MVSNTSQKQALLAIFLSTEKEIKLPKAIKRGKVLQKLKKSVSHSSFITELKKYSVIPLIAKHLKPLKNLSIKNALLLLKLKFFWSCIA